MNDDPEKTSSVEERARRALAEGVRAAGAVHLQACVACGLCAETCHVWRARPVPENLPPAKAARVVRHFRRYHTLLGRLVPGLSGARPFTRESLEELVDAAFGRCTGCGRCGLHCAVGVDVAGILRLGRRILAAAGMVPEELTRTLATHLDSGNQVALPAEELRSTAEWLAEDLASEMGDEAVRIPLDAKGARILYLINPREVKFFPLSLMAAAGIFHAAGVSWTLSSRVFDNTNYGFFAGDDEGAGELVRRVLEEARALGVEEVVVSECGHGFRALRWEGPRWTGAPHPLPVRSVVEVLDGLLAEGRLQVDPARNPDRITLHDPCNLVRWGGVVEPQRRILRRVAAHFVEMTPNRLDNYCCGGGGGLLAVSAFARERAAAGEVKAEQIRATGAKVVAAPCHNCCDQLLDLSKKQGLGVEVLTLCELVYNALVPPAPAPPGSQE